MKIQNYLNIVLLLTLFLSANLGFSQTSTKGNWTASEREKAMTELNTTRNQLDELIGEAGTDKIFDCAMEKMQVKYKNFAEADSDYDGMRLIGKTCMEDVMATGISFKGQWNETDREKAMAEMSSERDELDELLGTEKTDAFMSCVLDKIEQAYPNFETADNDLTGVEAIAEDCINEILDSGISMRGNWNSQDLEKVTAEFDKERSEIESLIGVEKTDEFFECAMYTIEQTYPNYEAADNDISGLEKIGEDCMNKVLE